MLWKEKGIEVGTLLPTTIFGSVAEGVLLVEYKKPYSAILTPAVVILALAFAVVAVTLEANTESVSTLVPCRTNGGKLGATFSPAFYLHDKVEKRRTENKNAKCSAFSFI